MSKNIPFLNSRARNKMDWIRGYTIGHGSTAAVSVATSKISGEVFAVKSAELSQSEPLQREHKILSTLNNSDHVVAYKGCNISLENSRPIFNLMMEYAPKGTIADEVRRRHDLDESKVGYYTCGIAKGLEYLHSKGIVHCDIKGSNILLIELDEVRITDFGCAKFSGEAAIGGTPLYMSPEVARGEEQGFPADIWALGCTVIEMSTGKPPWPNAATTLRRIAFSGESPEIPDFLSGEAKDFLNKCLRVDPKERWTAKELLQHPFVHKFRFENLKKIEDSTDSPTSILDQGIWSLIEEEVLETPCEVNYEGFLDSPLQRIKELEMNSHMENWVWRESWITVRDSKNVDIGIISSRDKCRRHNHLVLGRSLNLKRCTEEFVFDQCQFL